MHARQSHCNMISAAQLQPHAHHWPAV